MSLKQQWLDLLKATLETWSHQLLFVRRVYPRDSFCETRFLAVNCHANRHPDVVAYIQESVRLAAESFVARVADEMSLIILDNSLLDGDDVLEVYSLRISDMIAQWDEWSDGKEAVHALERGMRDLVIQTKTLEVDPLSPNDAMSFKITLHIPEKDTSCEDLNAAFAEGRFVSKHATTLDSEHEAPGWLHTSSLDICNLHFTMRRKPSRN
jgi:hypothetical protein